MKNVGKLDEIKFLKDTIHLNESRRNGLYEQF